MDGKGCSRAVFSSTSQYICKQNEQKEIFCAQKDLFGKLLFGSFMDYATMLESTINFGMGLK